MHRQSCRVPIINSEVVIDCSRIKTRDSKGSHAILVETKARNPLKTHTPHLSVAGVGTSSLQAGITTYVMAAETKARRRQSKERRKRRESFIRHLSIFRKKKTRLILGNGQ